MQTVKKTREGFSIALYFYFRIFIFYRPGLPWHHFDNPLQWVAQPLKIISESGLTKEVVLRNYDHLIEYCSPFYRGSLSFPDFPSSPSALSHFAETKTLFSYLSLAVPVCFFAGVLLIALKEEWDRQTFVGPTDISHGHARVLCQVSQLMF